ncbi:hypothetical protein [Cellulophaga baltica]|uniref:Lipoprotein n=1 Tax=Cellulophaga baltica 18 TaxID=1348584 RepID=A0AAU8RQM5_9FLAO|nr:hypothetical protein [Cellulophaga baltica]AIZ42451.1 hypothetical protein M666_13205 [Cellulophaga baltica 18]
MKKIIFVSLIILFLNCENDSREIRYYPTDNELINQNHELIDLDTTKLNFRQITDSIDDGYFDNDYGNMIVEFDDGKIKKRIIAYFYGSGLIKRKNVLQIKSDSILIDNGYPISELKRILKQHYLNKGQNEIYSDSPSKALVEVTIDTNKNGKQLKEVLTRITRSFDDIKSEIRDSIQLRVFFDYSRQTTQIPLPPKIYD